MTGLTWNVGLPVLITKDLRRLPLQLNELETQVIVSNSTTTGAGELFFSLLCVCNIKLSFGGSNLISCSWWILKILPHKGQVTSVKKKVEVSPPTPHVSHFILSDYTMKRSKKKQEIPMACNILGSTFVVQVPYGYPVVFNVMILQDWPEGRRHLRLDKQVRRNFLEIPGSIVTNIFSHKKMESKEEVGERRDRGIDIINSFMAGNHKEFQVPAAILATFFSSLVVAGVAHIVQQKSH